MNGTDNDLSYDLARIDYNALVTTAEQAFAMLRNEIARDMNLMYPRDYYDGIGIDSATTRIKRHATHLVVVANTLHVLYEMKNRPKFELVNHPYTDDQED
jgi:hypothetical protein